MPFLLSQLLTLIGEAKLPGGKKFQPVYEPVMDSTMNCAFDAESAGLSPEAGYVYIAGTQTHGTGRDGRWVSEPKDVAMTLLLENEAEPRTTALIRYCAGIAVLVSLREILRGVEGITLSFKPRNDVYVLPGARKICGVLVVEPADECGRAALQQRGYRLSPNWILAGIGVNLGVEATRAPGLRGHPVSAEELFGHEVSREQVIAAILRNFSALYGGVKSGRCDDLYGAMNESLWTDSEGLCVFELCEDEVPRNGRFLHADARGIHFEVEGEQITVAHENIRRIYPAGMKLR